MRIVIVGAGQVGSTVAASLAEVHDVVVVDRDGDRVERLQYEEDVLGIEGDGAAVETLADADVADADVLVACTDDDQTNLVTCGTARVIDTDCFTIARVRDTKFLRTWRRAEGALGVDFMVGTNLLTAETIVGVIGLPAARDLETFADGLVHMAEFEIGPESPVRDQTVAEADRFDSLTFAAIIREGTVTIPTGQTRIAAGDDVVVIGSPESVHQFGTAVAPELADVREVLVIGGSDVGAHTARLLAERGLSPRLVEREPARARQLAEDLPNTTVLENDATDRAFLERENVDDVEVVVVALDNDEKNLLAGLFAKRLGADRAVVVVADPDYVPLFEAVGVDVAVNPREATAEQITRFTRERTAENVAIVEDDRAEVLEIRIEADSVLAGRAIREAVADLPDGVVIGALTRDGESIRPRGHTVVQEGDHVVCFVDETVLETATGLL